MRVEKYLKLSHKTTKAPLKTTHLPTKKARKSKPSIMSFARHRIVGSGKGKNPRIREAMKREAEANLKLKSWIKDPKSMTEIFKD